ncbi:MAG TPA: hypothetical protein VGG06_15415 [Thermoanaerobaculia bacterium]|jgi:hypothetical protein
MRKLALLLLGALAALAAGAQDRWRGPDGGFLPFATDEEVLAFLRDAEVIERRGLAQGINRPLKVRLRLGAVEAHAVYRTVNVRKPREESGGKVYLDFHDSCLHECAAYEMSRLLGLDHVPPCVVRDVGRLQGTLQLWIEDAMTEEKRRREGKEAPVPVLWARQQQTLHLFDALIYNFDRNQGNMLIDPDWKLWFIDHTRAFHKSAQVERLDRVIWCERDLWRRLRSLDPGEVLRRLDGLLGPDRIAPIMKRRDLLVRHLERRIAEAGEGAVLYVAGTPDAGTPDAGLP